MVVTRTRPLAWIVTAGLALLVCAGRPAFAAEPVSGSVPSTSTAASASSTPASPTLQAAAQAAGQAAASTLAAQPTVPAAEPEKSKWPVTGGVTADFMSHYMWRGFLLTDAFAFQPTAWGKFGDLTLSSWSSWSDVDGGPATEHDLTVDYTRAVHPKVNLSVGYINYFFPAVDSGRHSDEFYVVSAFVAPLNPTVKAYFDVHEGKGTYLNFGISHPVPLGKGITATPSFAIGYNHEQWIDDSTWNDANFGLKLNIPIGAHLALGPGVYYSKGLTDFDDLIPDKFYGGLSVAVTF
jgi:hypothetical protein